MTEAPPFVCYRHPDRPTRLACSTCGRPICVECSRDAAVGQKCPDCAAPEGRHRVITSAAIRNPASTAPVTIAVIAIALLVFLAGEFDPVLGRRMLIEGAYVPSLVSAGEWWRAFTSMFLHGGLMHVLFNMWALYVFGPALEHRYGHTSYAALYVASGLGGGALYHLIGRDLPAVGASGAIFGLLGALLATTYRQRYSPAGRAIFSQLLILLALNLAIPFIVPNVAWEAHVGGLVVGLVVAGAWSRLPLAGPGAARRRVAVAAVAATLAMAVMLLA